MHPQNNHNTYQNQYYNAVNHLNRNHISHYQQNSDKNQHQNNHKSSNHIEESRPNGTTFKITSSATAHDDEHLYGKVTEDIKQARLNQLGNNGIDGTLQGIKRPNQLRLFITQVAPATSEGEIEYYLLENFPDISKVIVRKTKMFKNRYYASFVVLVISNIDTILELEDFQEHNWPENIKVYKGREPDYQQPI